jgi:predicted nucleic acid-binding protein
VILAGRVAALFPDLPPVTREDLLCACGLIRRYPRLPVRDDIHAATMLHNGLRQIVSLDPDFDQIRGVQRIDPAEI